MINSSTRFSLASQTATLNTAPVRPARCFCREHSRHEQQQAAYHNGGEASDRPGHDDSFVCRLISKPAARPVQRMHGINQIILAIRSDRLWRLLTLKRHLGQIPVEECRKHHIPEYHLERA